MISPVDAFMLKVTIDVSICRFLFSRGKGYLVGVACRWHMADKKLNPRNGKPCGMLTPYVKKWSP